MNKINTRGYTCIQLIMLDVYWNWLSDKIVISFYRCRCYLLQFTELCTNTPNHNQFDTYVLTCVDFIHMPTIYCKILNHRYLSAWPNGLRFQLGKRGVAGHLLSVPHSSTRRTSTKFVFSGPIVALWTITFPVPSIRSVVMRFTPTS